VAALSFYLADPGLHNLILLRPDVWHCDCLSGLHPVDDILGGTAAWVGWDNFIRFFKLYNFWDLFANTFLLCLFGFLIGFPIPIIVALALNSCRSKRISKVLQTIFYAPHFISLVVLVGMLYLLFGQMGLVNNIRTAFGLARYSFFLEADAFRPLYIFSGNWQDFGWSAIIYLAALSGVDPALHEAAEIDGASRLRRVFAVDIPAIMPTISVMLILSIGNLMSVGYEKALLMQTDANLKYSEIIATYVYKAGLVNGDYGFGTAVGLFSSIINLVLLIGANTLSRRFSENSLW